MKKPFDSIAWFMTRVQTIDGKHYVRQNPRPYDKPKEKRPLAVGT